MTENDISYLIRGSIFDIHNYYGPGLYENVYKKALTIALTQKGLIVKREVEVNASFKQIDLGLAYRLDILVENKVIIEAKSIEQLLPVHSKQLLTYLKLMDLKLGILVNFNCAEISQGIHRIANKL